MATSTQTTKLPFSCMQAKRRLVRNRAKAIFRSDQWSMAWRLLIAMTLRYSTVLYCQPRRHTARLLGNEQFLADLGHGTAPWIVMLPWPTCGVYAVQPPVHVFLRTKFRAAGGEPTDASAKPLRPGKYEPLDAGQVPPGNRQSRACLIGDDRQCTVRLRRLRSAVTEA